MRSKIAEEILKASTEDETIFVSWYADLVVRIHELLAENNLSQRDLAEKMGKTAPEISRWLSGNHNFTLRSLAKLQAELGGILIHVPSKTKFRSVYTANSSTTVVRKIGGKSPDVYNNDYNVSEDITLYNKLPA